MRALALAVALLSAVGVSQPTLAAEAPAPAANARSAALTLLKEGNRLLDAGHAAEALAKFKEAHALVGGDKLQFNFAQAYRAMPGHEIDAYEAYGLFLARASGSSPDLVAFAAREQKSLRALLALVQVTTRPPGVNVVVDGTPRGTTPLAERLVLRPGAHVATLSRVGFRTAEEHWSLEAGQNFEPVVELQVEKIEVVKPALASTLTAGPSSKTPEGPGKQTIDLRAPADESTSTSAPIYKTWWFWGAVGVVVVGGVVGAFVATRSSGNDCPPTSSGLCPKLP